MGRRNTATSSRSVWCQKPGCTTTGVDEQTAGREPSEIDTHWMQLALQPHWAFFGPKIDLTPEPPPTQQGRRGEAQARRRERRADRTPESVRAREPARPAAARPPLDVW